MERPRFEKHPLGPEPKSVRISEEEMHLAYLHREQTGEPIQSWIRRLIRENWNNGLVTTARSDIQGDQNKENLSDALAAPSSIPYNELSSVR